MSLPPAPRDASDLAALWAARGIDAGAVQPDSRGTIGRSALRVAETLAARPLAAALAGPAGPDELELGPIIGRGGMGVVRLATQTALKRTVAVKQVHDASDEVVAALLREAWIAGNLEHPNILPIHTLTSAQGGPPLLVMKRIEGVPWTQVLADPASAPGEAPIEDPLEWHLRVFARVCRAVHFAHAQGIVHLDIKPDNVMLGRFGEVYLVDWGLAASLDADVPRWMPRAADIATVVGTPAYMAPELALGAGAKIDARTDVYLLGAVLHEIVTGQRLHTGTVLEAVTSAWRSEAPTVAGAAPELAHICRRAVAREAADRYESADALRLEVESFLQHRHATGLADEALARLGQLEARLADGDDAEIQRLIDECRFGLRLALRAWPGQVRAQEGLARLLRLVAERHLARDELDAARALLAELAAPPPALVARVEARATALAERQAALTALSRDHDLSLNRRQRLRWVWVIGLAWIVWNFAAGALHRSGLVHFTYTHLIGMSVVTLGLFGAGAWYVRRTLRQIAVDRKIIDMVGAGLSVVLLVWIAGAVLGLPPLTTVAMSLPLYVLFMAIATVTVETRLRWVPFALAPLTILAALFPDFAFEIGGLAGFGISAPTAITWARGGDEGAPR